MKLYDDRMRAVAYRMLGSQSAMDDALQAAYLKAFRNIGGFRREAAFSSWLQRIVVNACYDSLRRSSRRSEISLDQVPDRATVGSVEDRVVQNQQLHSALQNISDDLRAVVVLVDGEGLSYAEADEALGIERGTIASRLHRARAALRHQLGLSQETIR